MVKVPKLRLTSTQITMLKNVRDGLDPCQHCTGMSEYGGADGTRRSLIRRELLAWDHDTHDLVITALGRSVLAERTT